MAISERKLDLICKLVREHCLKYTELNVIIDNACKGIRWVSFTCDKSKRDRRGNPYIVGIECTGLDRGVITKITVTIPYSKRTTNKYREQHVFTSHNVLIHSYEVTAQEITKDIDEILATM